MQDCDDIQPALPSNVEVEQAIIGGIFINNSGYARVAEFLRPEHFWNGVHARIFTAIGKLIDRGEPANPLTLKNLFDQDGALTEIGGAAYLVRLAESAVTIINIPHYGRTIHDLYLRREMITIGQELVSQAFRADIDMPPTKIAEGVDRALAGLIETATPRHRGGSIAAAVKTALADAELAYKSEGKSAGLSTGLIDVDKALGGMAAGDLIVLAGASSQGKTSWLIQVADFLATRGEPVGICELEQTAPQLAQRILAHYSGVSVHRQRRGEIDPLIGWPAYVSAAERVSAMPIYIDDTPAMGLSDIRRQAHRWRARHGIKLLAIDHLQLMRGDRREGRRLEIDDFADGLKSLAKELDIPILLLSQMNRAIALRDSKRPILSDLRESAGIEQAADVVLFLFREEYYLAQNEPTRRLEESDDKFNTRYESWRQQLENALGLADCIIAKNRSGPIKTVRTYWDGESMRFDNYVGPERLPMGDY